MSRTREKEIDTGDRENIIRCKIEYVFPIGFVHKTCMDNRWDMFAKTSPRVGEEKTHSILHPVMNLQHLCVNIHQNCTRKVHSEQRLLSLSAMVEGTTCGFSFVNRTQQKIRSPGFFRVGQVSHH